MPRYMPCKHATLYTTLYAIKCLPAAAAAPAAARDHSALPYINGITPDYI